MTSRSDIIKTGESGCCAIGVPVDATQTQRVAHLLINGAFRLTFNGESCSGNCIAPPLPYQAMTLQEILFGKFTPPPASDKTITHLIGFECQPRYEQSVKTVRKIQAKIRVDGLTPHQQRVMKVLRSRRAGVSAREIANITGFAKSYCNVVLAGFWKDGIVTRTKSRVALTMQYVYKLKASDAS